MKSHVHAVAGITAIVLVASFMTATIIVEALGDPAAVLATKTAILFALLILIPSVMVAGASGRSLMAGRRTSPLLRAKKRRTAVVAVIGLVVLLPAAVTLRSLAATGDFGMTFIVVQVVELVGGAVNLTLLGLNARAGRLLTAARRRRQRNARVAATTPA
jgi:hypothetical protein